MEPHRTNGRQFRTSSGSTEELLRQLQSSVTNPLVPDWIPKIGTNSTLGQLLELSVGGIDEKANLGPQDSAVRLGQCLQ